MSDLAVFFTIPPNGLEASMGGVDWTLQALDGCMGGKIALFHFLYQA